MAGASSIAAQLAQYAYSPAKVKSEPSPARGAQRGVPESGPSTSARRLQNALASARASTGDVDVKMEPLEDEETPDPPPARRSARNSQQKRLRDSDASDFAPSDSDTPTRQSPYFSRTGEVRMDDDPETPSTPTRSRRRRDDGSLEDFGWKKPRRFASPSRYAHLPALSDALRPGLDIVFVGINPGTRSSKTGHFFAHPTNKFWKALHGGGLTPRLLTPEEDVTLPDEYNYGMTNLVSRTTAEQAELSGHEKRVAVAPLATKMALNRPRVVCFVGKMIWDVFAGVAKRSIPKVSAKNEPSPSPQLARVVEYTLDSGGAVSREQDEDALVKIEPGEAPAAPKRGKAKAKGKSTPKPKPKAPPFIFDAPQPLRLAVSGPEGYVYFWVVPNTSGLERTKLEQQVVYFDALRAFVETLKAGQVPEGEFVDVTAEGIERVVEAIREKGE